MKVCIVGAGAIGGLMGAKLALAGEEVTVVDQGRHLKAIQENGLKLIWENGTEIVAEIAKATDKVKDAGVQDLIILGLKAHYLDQVAGDIPKITGPDTMIVTVQNGIPWWYFHKHAGPFEGHTLESLDPSGVLGKHIDADKIIGGADGTFSRGMMWQGLSLWMTLRHEPTPWIPSTFMPSKSKGSLIFRLTIFMARQRL